MYTQSHHTELEIRGLLAGFPEPSHSNRFRPSSDEKFMTLLMCDIVDSTKLSTNLSASDMRSLLIDYYSICAEDLNDFRGSEPADSGV